MEVLPARTPRGTRGADDAHPAGRTPVVRGAAAAVRRDRARHRHPGRRTGRRRARRDAAGGWRFAHRRPAGDGVRHPAERGPGRPRDRAAARDGRGRPGPLRRGPRPHPARRVTPRGPRDLAPRAHPARGVDRAVAGAVPAPGRPSRPGGDQSRPGGARPRRADHGGDPPWPGPRPVPRLPGPHRRAGVRGAGEPGEGPGGRDRGRPPHRPPAGDGAQGQRGRTSTPTSTRCWRRCLPGPTWSWSTTPPTRTRPPSWPAPTRCWRPSRGTSPSASCWPRPPRVARRS